MNDTSNAAEAATLTDTALDDVRRERARQDKIWGEQRHPSFDQALLQREPQRMAERYEIPTEARAKWLCQTMAARGECTYADIALEEFAEVVATCGEDETETRGELVQLAAVVVQWIEAIDRRKLEAGPS